MRLKISFRLALLSLCCLASLQWTLAAVTSAPSPVKLEETTEGPKIEEWTYPRTCYVEKSKVEELIVQMNSTVRILNQSDGNLKCHEKLEAKIVVLEDEDIAICSEERIQRIQKDLFKVAGSLFQAAIRLTEPSEKEIDKLDLIKFQLVKDLEGLNLKKTYFSGIEQFS